MKLRTILAGVVLAALVAPAAAGAQSPPPPVNGGTEVGGRVNSFLELILAQPSKGFAAFSKTKSYEMSFDAQVTATDEPTLLTLADGDATSGSKLGTSRSAPSACRRRWRRRSARPRSSRSTARSIRC